MNFILKEAVYEKPKYQLIVEGGFNGLRNELGDYRLIGQASRRLFDESFGISAHLGYENRNRSSNSVSSDYKYLPEYTYRDGSWVRINYLSFTTRS